MYDIQKSGFTIDQGESLSEILDLALVLYELNITEELKQFRFDLDLNNRYVWSYFKYFISNGIDRKNSLNLACMSGYIQNSLDLLNEISEVYNFHGLENISENGMVQTDYYRSIPKRPNIANYIAEVAYMTQSYLEVVKNLQLSRTENSRIKVTNALGQDGDINYLSCKYILNHRLQLTVMIKYSYRNPRVYGANMKIEHSNKTIANPINSLIFTKNSIIVNGVKFKFRGTRLRESKLAETQHTWNVTLVMKG